MPEVLGSASLLPTPPQAGSAHLFTAALCRAGDKYNLVLADNRPMSEAKDSDRKEGAGPAPSHAPPLRPSSPARPAHAGSCAGDTTLAAHERFVLLDITQYDEFLAAAQGVDTIVHLAATPGAPDDPCAPRSCFFAGSPCAARGRPCIAGSVVGC